MSSRVLYVLAPIHSTHHATAHPSTVVFSLVGPGPSIASALALGFGVGAVDGRDVALGTLLLLLAFTLRDEGCACILLGG